MNFFLIVILLLSAFVLSQNQTKLNGIIALLIVVLMSWIVAIRDMTVPDTIEYVEWYLKDYDIFNFASSPYEKGYTVFSRTIHNLFGDNYQLFFFIFPLLNFILLSKASKIICNVISSSREGRENTNIVTYNVFSQIVIYFSYYGLYHIAIVLRVGVATTLLMLSLAFLLRNRGKIDIIASLLFFLLALSFHTSLLVCLPMYWLVRHNLFFLNSNYYIFLTSIFLIYILSPYLGVIMAPINQLFLIMGNSDYNELAKYDYYQGSSTFVSAGISFKFLYFYFWGWLFVAYKDKNDIWYRMLNIYLIGLLVWAIFRPVLWVERITDYYTFFYVILAMIFFAQQRKIVSSMLMLITSFIQLIFVFRIISA